MTYVRVRYKTLVPYTHVKIGDTVCYKNGNGNWYKGKVTSKEEWHIAMFMPPPDNKRLGITVDFGDHTLIQQKSELFTINKQPKAKLTVNITSNRDTLQKLQEIIYDNVSREGDDKKLRDVLKQLIKQTKL